MPAKVDPSQRVTHALRHDRAFVGAAGSTWSFVNKSDAQMWRAGGAGQREQITRSDAPAVV